MALKDGIRLSFGRCVRGICGEAEARSQRRFSLGNDDFLVVMAAVVVVMRGRTSDNVRL
jgi:hypothetical protein